MRFEFGGSAPPWWDIWEIRLVGSGALGTVTVYVSTDEAPANSPAWMREVVDAVREWRKIDPWYPGTNGSAR